MNNFHETTRAQFVDQAAKAYMRGDFEAAAWFEKQVERHTVKPVAAKPAATPEAKARCPHYRLIRRFFAIAREAGLDTSQTAKPQMRHALETAMGRCVNSRSEVSAGEWQMLGDLIKRKRLAW
jgi:hypothetical protein